MTDVAVLAVVIAAVSLARERIRSLPVTTPMIFVGLGLVLGPEAIGLIELDVRDEAVLLLAEFTLALVLFSDATRIEPSRDKLSIAFGGIWAARDGLPVEDYDEAPVAEHLKGQEVDIMIDLGIAGGRATVWTCDLTHGYISINADYRS